jgi:hypothetical protein
MRRFVLSFFACFAFVLAPVFAQSQPPEELFVPILINGLVDESWHYQTLFRFLEVSGTTASPVITVQLDAFDSSGKRIVNDQLFCPPPVATLEPFRVSLPGLGSIHFGTKGFIQPYHPAPGIVDGWVRLNVKGPGKLEATAEILQVDAIPAGCPPVICMRPSGVYRSDAVVRAVKPAKVFHAATVITPFRHTGFSIVNPSETESAHVSVVLIQADGLLLQSGRLTIPPLQKQSGFAWEWVNTLPPVNIGIPSSPMPTDFYGSAQIVSDIPIVVGALQVLLPEGKLVTAVVTPEP